MGFYTEYFSTLFKGLGAATLKERIEARRAIKYLHAADKILYTTLVQHVEQEHKVSRALKRDEIALLRDLRLSLDNEYKLLFNVSTVDLNLLRGIESILKELEVLENFLTNSGGFQTQEIYRLGEVMQGILMAIYGALRKGEKEEREEYRLVMLVIDEAAERNRNKFMANIRLAFQEEKAQTILAKFAIRGNIRKAKIDITQLKRIAAKIREVRERLEKAKKEGVDKAIGELQGTINEIRAFCSDAFYELYLIIKRDILFALKSLLDLNRLREMNNEWVVKHYLPAEPIKKKNEQIDKLKEHLSTEFHTVAQAFRIIIHGIEKEEIRAQKYAGRAFYSRKGRQLRGGGG